MSAAAGFAGSPASSKPAPTIPPFYVQSPDEEEIRAVGWYMRRSRRGRAVFLGHSAAAAEAWLRELLVEQRKREQRKRAKSRVRKGGK